MQIKETYPKPLKRLFISTFFIYLFFLPAAKSQSTYLQKGDKQNILLERLEIKGQTDSVLNFSKTKPFNRKDVVNGLNDYIQRFGKNSLSKVDDYYLQSAYANNIEYLPDSIQVKYKSKRPFAKNYYRTPANLYEAHVKDFDLIVNPIIQFSASKERNNSEKLFLNTRGVYVRGKIANKIGFYGSITDNQERDPLYVQQWVQNFTAVPGEGFYKSFKGPGGLDYFDAEGYFTFKVMKYIDAAFGYDRNFIGNGYRSLFLSDFGSPYLFLKLNTRIWKLNYQNLFMELAPADAITGNRYIGKKYAAMHHLDVSVTRWLNIGLFEGITFGRKDHFDFGYLNPVIFYRYAEQQNGSNDKSHEGIDFKANVAKRFQFYGQFFLDEFVLSEVKANRGAWVNKWAYQLGAKYIDAFNIKNLDLQLETNRVRPFTYSHTDSVSDYTHFNQPLAHPLGANFQEFIGIARYQPAPKWLIVAKAIYYYQGRDSSNISYGSNIFLPSAPPYRTMEYGYFVGSGWKTDVMYTSLLLSYELKENLFFELNAVYRKLDTKTAPIISQTSSVISIGVRWNIARREFDF